MIFKLFYFILIGVLCTGDQDNSDKISKEFRHSANWCYPKIGHPFPYWSGLCDTGSSQSPIQLNDWSAKKAHYMPFIFNNYDTYFESFSIFNSGHGVSIPVPKFLNITIVGGPLKYEYVLENIHWHWGGTEHVLDEPQLILEMHLLHRNMKYSRKDAQNHRNGFAVLSILYKRTKNSNKLLKSILENVDQIIDPGCYADINMPLKIREFLPDDVGVYFTYRGSLTTPPCLQAVTWIVFTDFLPASMSNIRQFKAALSYDGSLLDRNCRNLQPLNNRTVYFNTMCCY